MATNHLAANSPSQHAGSHGDTEQTPDVSSEEYFELLGDEYTRRVLEALTDEPRTGREIIDRTDVSKPTVYRRLARLEEAGLVSTTQKIDTAGHHCKRYHMVVDAIDFRFERDGIDISIETDDVETSHSCDRPVLGD